ncbi:MAG: TIGR04084 family radical SAM/SPASM domain-containing protein [Thermoplasmata archaeon]
MLYLLTTTGKCNLKCRYCGGSFPEELVPYKIKYNIDSLIKMINSDSDATVVYYGGEPLMNSKFIQEINSRLKIKRIGIQTNGTLVKNFDKNFWRPFSFALLSLDGDESLTDKNRGKDVYKGVIDSSLYLKNLGKELIARMTVTKDSNIYEDVIHILDLSIFDKVHWQLDVIWDEKWDIIKFADDVYLPGLEKLMDLFVENVRSGKILKIIPFIGILSAYYFRRFDYYPCGAGKNSITINPDGRILACPIAVSEKWNDLGHIDNGFKLIDSPFECKNCKYFSYCGGRCLFAFKERYWGDNGFKDVCYMTKRTIDIILSRVGELDEIIKQDIIDKNSLFYDPIKDSTEIIP